MLLHFFYIGIILVGFLNIRFVKPRNLSQNINKYSTANDKIKETKEDLKLISKSINNGIRNFSEDKIVLNFNKEVFLNTNFIKLQGKNNKSNVLDIFKFAKKGNSIIITFKNKPKKDNTYIITFLKKSIFSFTGEHINDFDIIFSCGDEIDSYKLKGSVYDLLLNEKLSSDCYVCLYKLTQDEIKKGISKNNILNCQNPDYFKLCNDGNFSFENIGKGEYFVCAGEVDTNTLTSNQRNHKYGFIKNFISFDSKNLEYEEVNIDILNNDITEYKITAIKHYKKNIIIETNEPIANYDIKIDEKLSKYFTNFTDKIKIATSIDQNNNKQIIIDNTDLGLISNDILPCVITIKNKFGEEIKKNIDISFSSSISNDYTNKNSLKNDNQLNVVQISNEHILNSLANFKIISGRKIVSLDPEKINIYISDENFSVKKGISNFKIINESSVNYIITNKNVYELLKNMNNLTQKEKIIFNKSNIYVNIYFLEGALTYEDYTKNKEIVKSILFARKYSSIPIELNIKSKNCKLELIDKRTMTLKDEIYCNSNDKNKIFKNVPFGKYLIRYFIWNGIKWNKGNIFRNENHDIIKFYNEDIYIFNENQHEKIKICE